MDCVPKTKVLTQILKQILIFQLDKSTSCRKTLEEYYSIFLIMRFMQQMIKRKMLAATTSQLFPFKQKKYMTKYRLLLVITAMAFHKTLLTRYFNHSSLQNQLVKE